MTPPSCLETLGRLPVLLRLTSKTVRSLRAAAPNKARPSQKSQKPASSSRETTAVSQFPGYRTIESGDFEEERRLFYVAVTRAKNELYICYPRVASRPGPGGMMLQPTRFLSELSDELRTKRSFRW